MRAVWTCVVAGLDTLVLIGGCNGDVLLTRRPLSGLEVTEKDGVPVRLDLISPKTKASETVFRFCIPLSLDLCGF